MLRIALALPLSLALYSATFAETAPQPGSTPVRGLPQILAINIPPTRDFHAGETIRGTVETSSNVGYVEARIQYRNQPLHRDGMGKFSLVYKIPWWLPPWLRHDWTLQIIARSVDGVEVKQDLPITVH